MRRGHKQRKAAQRAHHQKQGPMRVKMALEAAEKARKSQKKGKAFIAACMDKAGFSFDPVRQRWVATRPMSSDERERVNQAVS